MEKPEEVEIKIPVLSVLKNGCILKNIFINIPPPELNPFAESCEEDGEEDPILVGRHPDCHIALDHPSISRFHLEIRAKLALQKLSVTDLSSVHGTWVSEARIPPNVPIDLVEGDTVRLGASNREYRLQWVPLNRAFEMENPLPPLLEEKEETHQENNSEQLMADLDELCATQIPSAPPLLEDTNPSPFNEPSPLPSEKECQSPASRDSAEENLSFCSVDPILESVGSPLPREEENGISEVMFSEKALPEQEHQSPLRSKKQAMSSSLLSRRSKSKSISFLSVYTGRSQKKKSNLSLDRDVEVGIQKENSKNTEQIKGRAEPLCRVLFDGLGGKGEEEEEIFLSDKENMTPKISVGQSMKKGHKVLQRSSTLQAAANMNSDEEVFYSDKENWTPEAHKKSKPNKENWTPEVHRDPKPNKTTSGKPVRSEREEETFDSDKENLTPGVSSALKLRKSSVDLHRLSSNVMAVSSDVEDVSHSDKENHKPEVPRDIKARKLISENHTKMEEEDAFPSDKENLTPQASRSFKSKGPIFKTHSRIENEKMRKGVDNIPFQPLMEDPSPRNTDFVDHAHSNVDDGDCTSVNNVQRTDSELNHFSIQSMVEQVPHKAGEEKKTWNIVVDTGCFLDEESRRSLQLLEGLKGTHLIIPRIVIRELDCMKRRESMFRKSTRASSVLQWIEECMLKASWWIHVQSSSETMAVAPTPPASPRSQLGDGDIGFGAGSSAYRSLMEIVSPTAEDHILDCALLFKKIKNDGQLVLLSNSVTLKIKAMAEGLLCETPDEFRESLVNPYSKRFLWADSSPRGFTWSCTDEVGLMENNYYQRPPLRKTAKAAEAVKGLKLILLHNSYYGQTNSLK